MEGRLIRPIRPDLDLVALLPHGLVISPQGRRHGGLVFQVCYS